MIFTGYEGSHGLERVGGAYRISTALRKHDWDIEVIDFFYVWDVKQLMELIDIRNKKERIEWIGFSITWLNYGTESTHLKLIEICKHLKKYFKHIKIIAGGQNPNLSLPIYENVDYIIKGFGEIAILELLKYLFSNGKKPKGVPVKNTWVIDANAFYQAWPIKDLSIEYQQRDFIFPNETLTLEFSRGCKFACAFCNFPILGVKEDTTVDLSILENDLRRNYDLYGVTNYQVADETLNDRDEKLINIGNIVNKLNFEPNFSAFIRGDILFLRKQQLELLANARVWGHYYGIETFNHETGKIIGKGLHPDKIKEGLLTTKEFFNKKLDLYRGTISLIYGLPKETIKSINEGRAWLAENWNDNSTVIFPFTITIDGKKSKIDENLEKYGYKIIKTETREHNRRHSFFAGDYNIWENPNMTLDQAICLAAHSGDIWSNYSDSWMTFSLFPLVNNLKDALIYTFKDLDTNKKINDEGKALKKQYVYKKLNL